MARILVVDDSTIMRRNLNSVLVKAGHTVVAEATNGGQAYLLYKSHLPDLVTMDITMPNVNGIEAVKKIIGEFPEAKIIMVSALNQRNMVFEALNLGAKHYIIKPIDPNLVISVINKVLGIEPEQAGQNADEAKDQAVEEVKDPFTIENSHDMFQIKLTKNFSEENIQALNQAVQGLLFVKPLKVVMSFGNIETLPDSILNQLNEIINKIQEAKGIIKVVAQTEKLVETIKNKKLDGLSKLIELQ